MNFASLAFPLARPVLHALDAETAHGLPGHGDPLQCRGGGGCWRDGGEVPAAHHSLERWRDWCGAVPGNQRRHELEADRDWCKRHLTHERIASNHSAGAASVVAS